MSILTHKLVVAAAIAVLLQSTEAAAQAPRTGSLSGTVRSAGVPAANVIVAVSSDSRVFTTDRSGAFVIPLLPVGEYALTIEHLGHRPTLVTGVRVNPGVDTPVEVDLRPLTGADVAVDTIAYTAHGADPNALARLSAQGRSWRRAVGARETLADLAGEYGYLLERSVDGLPFTSGTRYVDGVALPLDPDEAGALDLSRFPLPRLAVGSAALSVDGLSTAAGEAGVAWSVTSLPAPTTPVLEWSLAGGSQMGSNATRPSMEGSLFAGGRLGTDVGGMLAVEAGMNDRRQPSLAAASRPNEIANIGRAAFGLDSWSDDPFDLRTAYTNSVAGIDWRTGSQSLQLRARLSTQSLAAEDLPFSWIPRTGTSTASTAGLSFGLESALSARWSNLLHAGFETRRREGDAGPTVAGNGTAAPGKTTVVGLGLSLGFNPWLSSGFERTTASLSNRLGLRLRNHTLALEVSASGSRYLIDPPSTTQSRFDFGGARDLELLRGAFNETVSLSRAPEFEVARFAAALEERWTPRAGVDLLLGLRAETELRRPPARLPEPLWFIRTGMSYASPTSTFSVLPRVGLSIVQGQWQAIASAALHTESVQPLLLNEIYSELGTTRVRRRVGTIPEWPAAPDSLAAPFVGSRLTLTDPSFASPRTLRGNFSLSRSINSGSRISLSGSYRWTDKLPRRFDINRLAEPIGEDQYGRALYGRLVQEGALVQSQPGSSRRMAGFDMVSMLTSDGESRYAGVSVEWEQSFGSALRLLGSYTFSQTVDNLSLESARALNGAPFVSDLEQGEWTIGRSDFDVPHRARMGFELTVASLRSLEIAAFYRLRSGYPFTPSFHSAVDINGDEITGNEPAYLDPALPGYTELAGKWSCLDTAAGFASRNSCRAPSVSALDLRLSLPLAGRGELYLDGYTLFGGGDLLPDPALYLVDGNRSLSTDGHAVTSIPLLVNPAFGTPLLSAGTSRSVRVGLDVSF